MATTIWKGTLRWGEHAVPVRLHSAVEDRKVHFHLLHDQDMQRLKQRLVDPETGDTVEYQDSRKGLELEPGVLVMLDKSELESIAAEGTRDVDVLCFVDPSLINHQWYQRPYYLSPDGESQKYFALVKALEECEVEGVCKWTMRRKEYLGALRPYRGYLVLVTLRYADEVISADEVSPKEQISLRRELNPKEQKMAQQLVAALEDEFRPEDFYDEYQEQVRELIRRKRKGEAPPPVDEPAKPASASLADALEASLKAFR